MDPKVTQLLGALGFFKDWTNYLLVTTVAALGWIATKPVLLFTCLATLDHRLLLPIHHLRNFHARSHPNRWRRDHSRLRYFYDVPAKFQLFGFGVQNLNSN